MIARKIDQNKINLIDEEPEKDRIDPSQYRKGARLGRLPRARIIRGAIPPARAQR